MTASGPGRWFDNLVDLGSRQPLAEPVASDDDFYLCSQGRARIAWRTLRRMFGVAAAGQLPRLVDRIDRRWTRALWVHAEAPQIGDALMDLAPRSLLSEGGIAVDLLAPPAIASLFAGDAWLRRVFSDPAAIDPAGVDFVIAASHSAESLAAKRRHAPRLPWVSLKGYYAAYDYQRSAFGARRLAALLGTALDADALAWHGRQKLAVAGDGRAGGAPSAPVPTSRHVAPTIAIAVGGVRAERTYRHWPAVARGLAALGSRQLVLVGSGNGRRDADAIAAAVHDMWKTADGIDDRVGRLDLHATRAAIAGASLLACADGGLMHLGLTTATPLLALFPCRIDPAWRLPAGFDGTALRAADDDVSGVAPEQVVAAARRLLNLEPAVDRVV